MNDELLTALEYIDPAPLTHNEWLAVGIDLYVNGYDVETWDTWSQRDAARYKPRICAQKWRTFNGNMTGGTIIGMAYKNGFRPSQAERTTHRRPRRINPVDLIEDFTENAEKWDITAEITAAHEQLLRCEEKAVKTIYDGKEYNITPLVYVTRVRKIPLEVIKNKKIGFAPGGQNDILSRYPEYKRTGKTAQYHKIIFPFSNGNGGYNYFMTETTDRTVQIYDGKDKDGNATYKDITKYLKPRADNGTFETSATVPRVNAELYNEYLIKGSDVPPIIFICEGIYDALSIETVGGSAVAITGTGTGRLKSICKTFRPKTTFVISLDNDGAGQKAIDNLTRDLDLLNVRYIIRQAPKPYKDFNECLQHDPELLKRYVDGIAETTDADTIAERLITAWNNPITAAGAIDRYNQSAKNSRKRPKNAF